MAESLASAEASTSSAPPLTKVFISLEVDQFNTCTDGVCSADDVPTMCGRYKAEAGWSPRFIVL